MLAPVATHRNSEYDGILDWFKNLFHEPTINDLPPEQKAKIHKAIHNAKVKGFIFGATIGAIAVYLLLHHKNKAKTTPTQK